MTIETILTDDQILRTLSIVYGCSVSDVILHDAIAARRIEQAVLQSPQVQFLLTALEESNSLLVACAHEKRPWGEIEAQLGMNRDALINMGRYAE